jgi:hypothetical protein
MGAVAYGLDGTLLAYLSDAATMPRALAVLFVIVVAAVVYLFLVLLTRAVDPNELGGAPSKRIAGTFHE